MSDPTLNAYAASLAPPSYDRTKASARRAKVEQALRSSSLRIASIFESGSWTHGTAIKKKSDVDYMAIATSARPMHPSSSLATAKTVLAGCDWNVRNVSVSSPVVSVRYATPPHFEIAIAWYKEKVSGYDLYWIGGRGDDWVLSAPRAHLDYVSQQNERLDKRVKPLVRLLKAWKRHVDAPISSFYIEMRTAEYCSHENTILYDIDLQKVMSAINGAEARDMNDPKRIVGRIPACGSDDKRRRTLTMLRNATSSLRRANDAKQRYDRRAYWQAMRSIFGDDYPWPTW